MAYHYNHYYDQCNLSFRRKCKMRDNELLLLNQARERERERERERKQKQKYFTTCRKTICTNLIWLQVSIGY